MPSRRLRGLLDGHPDRPVGIGAAAWLSALTLLGAEAAGQAARQPPLVRPAPAELVEVDVNVVDSKGRPVRGLGKPDFRLYHDEHPAEIDVFLAPQTAEANSSASGLAVPTARDPQALLVVYIDRWLLATAGRRRTLQQVVRVAEGHLRLGARVLVMADEGGLRALGPVTSDVEEIRRLLGGSLESATVPRRLSDERETRDLVRQIVEGLGCESSALLGVVHAYATRRATEGAAAADALGNVVDALAGMPGRKSLLYVQEGLEQRPGIHLFAQLLEICPAFRPDEVSAVYAAMQDYDTSALVESVAARANAARVTVYAMDARGLATSSAVDVTRDDWHRPSAKIDALREANLTSPSEMLAEATGGFAIVRGLDAQAALRRFEAEDAGHYMLGFAPPGEPDGRIHALRVTVKAGSRIRVHHRRSYVRAEAAARRAQRAIAALVFGVEEDEVGALVDLRQSEDPLGASPSLHVWLPLASLAWELEPAGRVARVRIVVAFRPPRDQDGRGVTVREKELLVRAPSDPEPIQEAVHEIVVENVSTGGGPVDVAVGVEDLISGRAAYTRRRFDRAAERRPES